MSDNSAPRGYTVEEVPDTASVPPVAQASEPMQAPQQQFAQEPAYGPVVETQSSTPPTPPTEQPPVNGQPIVHNTPHNVHPIKKLLFLVPALLLVVTIFIVARLSGNNYTVRQPEPISTPEPTLAPTPSPTPTPRPVKSYQNDDMLIAMQIPEDYEILLEDENTISIGKNNTEIILINRERNTDYEDEETEEIIVGGKAAVRLSNVIHITEEPNYQISLFAENEDEEQELEKIIQSIIFLIDTSSWETFENTTYNYQIKYPPEWELTAPTDRDGNYPERIEISKDPEDRAFNNLVLQTSSNLTNAALTASEIVSSTRTLSGWSSPPSIKLQKLGGGDAQVIQGELTGKWRVYAVIWYKNTVIQITWDDKVEKGQQQTFENMLASFEFTN